VDWEVWQGEIDIQAPRVSIQAVKQSTSTQVTCSSTDFNLTMDNYQCPCTPLDSDKTTYDQVSDWYRETTGDTTRLYQIKSTCSVSTSTPLQMQRAMHTAAAPRQPPR